MTSYALRRIRARTESRNSRPRQSSTAFTPDRGRTTGLFIYQIQHEKLLVLVVRVGDRKDVYRRVK